MCPLLCKDNKNFRPNQKLSVREFGSIHFSTLRKHNRNREKRAERLRMYWRFHLILLKCRAFVITSPNLRHRNAEPSPIRCRTFGQLVEPLVRRKPNKESLQKVPKSTASKAFICPIIAISTALKRYWDDTLTTMGQYSCNYGTPLMQLWDSTFTQIQRKKTLYSLEIKKNHHAENADIRRKILPLFPLFLRDKLILRRTET